VKRTDDGVTGKKQGALSFMKSLQILAIAVASALPFSLHAQSVTDTSSTADAGSMSSSADAGQQQAKLMVPANAAVLQTIDAGKIESGSQFKVKLADTVHLNNGPELHSGTILVGTITKDGGPGTASKLTLRITQAILKDGTVVPIKATIVGVARPNNGVSQGYAVAPGDQEPNDWTSGTLPVKVLNAVTHGNFQSEIASDDSGVFTSTDNHDLKIPAGSEFKLAVAKVNN
jgi:hypothetical protein